MAIQLYAELKKELTESFSFSDSFIETTTEGTIYVGYT